MNETPVKYAIMAIMEKNDMRYGSAIAVIFIGLVFAVTLKHTTFSRKITQPVRFEKTDQPTMRSKSATVSRITLTIKCGSTLQSGAANHIAISLRNEGEMPVEFEPVSKRFRAPVFVVTRRGQRVGTTALGSAYLVRNPLYQKAVEPVRISKGEEVRAVVNLTRYYDLSLVDEYEIVAVWDGHTVGEQVPIRIKTEPLKFNVEIKPGESLSLP